MPSPELLTEDIERVEIVRAGGPYFGSGSAAGGDTVTLADLRAAADSFSALRDELWAPVKLGHNDQQDATREDYGGLLTGDGAPALGWLDNLRVEGAGLYADLRRVPRRVADLIRAGAYRARSIEFWRGYRDRSGTRHPMVITGLALLGARLPAVRGLEEMVKALYADAPSPADPGDATRWVAYATPGRRAYAVSSAYLPLADPDREWDEAAALGRVLAWAGATEGATDGTDAGPLSEPVLARLRSAFLMWDDGGGESLGDFRHLVADVVEGRLRAIPAAVYAAGAALTDAGDDPDVEWARVRLNDWYSELGATPPWGGHRPTPSVSSDDEFAAHEPGASTPNRESGMDPKELRAALGLAEDAGDEAVVAAIAAGREAGERATKLAADLDAITAAGDGQVAYADLTAKLAAQEAQIETLRGLAEQGVAAARTLYERERDEKLATAVRERRLAPAQVAEWTTKYDAAPDVVSELLGTLTPRTDLSADPQGHEGKGTADEQAALADAAYSAFFGDPKHPHVAATGKGL